MIIKKSKNTKEMAFQSLAIVVNMENKSWVKLTRDALEIISKIEDKEEEVAISILETEYGVTKEDASEFINYLVVMGVLEKQKEKEYIKVLNDKVDVQSKLGHCYLHITGKCNLQCGYCCIDANNHKQDLTTNQIKNIIRRLSMNKVNQLVFSGGEPLLRSDFQELVLYAKKMVPDIGMVSNATLITEENAEFIAKNIDKIQISLDSGIEEVHDSLRGKGSYQKTIRGIRLLKQYGHDNIKVTPTVNKKNISNIESIVEVVRDLDVMMEARFILAVGRGDKNQDEYCINYKDMYGALLRIWKECDRLDYQRYNVKEFYDLYMKGKVSCGVCKSQICIDVNGDIYPCAYLMNDDVKIGNIFEQANITETISKSPIGRKIANYNVDNMPKCKDCEVRYFCGGGCMSMRYNATGDVYGDDIDCAYYRKLFGQLVWGAADDQKESLLKALGLREE